MCSLVSQKKSFWSLHLLFYFTLTSSYNELIWSFSFNSDICKHQNPGVIVTRWFFLHQNRFFSLYIGVPLCPISGYPLRQPLAGGIMLSHHLLPGRSVPTTVLNSKPRQIPSSFSASLSPSTLSLLYAADSLQHGASHMACLCFACPGGLWAQLGSWTSNDLTRSSQFLRCFFSAWKLKGKKKISERNWLKSALLLSSPPPFWIDIPLGQKQALSNGDHSSDDL